MSGLVAQGLDAGYGALQVLRGASLAVEAGSVTLLTGPNGAGKTTFLRVLLGSVRPTAGTVHLDGTDLGPLDQRDRLRAGIGWVPEGRALFPGLTVRENLRVAARAWGVPRSEVATRVDDVVDRFPLVAAKIDAPVATLSGGQQQAVAVGRAFLRRPRLLLLDEPSTGLAPIAWLGVLETCRAAADQGAAVVIVEQRLLDAIEAVDRTAVMVRGTIVREAGAAEARALEDAIVRDYFSRESYR
jgi:ABC-type branched-subunit amino acid transport system ATPase component